MSEYNFKPIFRTLLTSRQFQNEKCLKIWIWCLLKATDQPFTAFVGRQEVPLVRGQFVFGTLRAIEELKMSSSTIWFWLHWLEKEESVAIKSTNKFSIISILKQPKFDEILDGLLGNKKETKKKQKTTYNKDNKEKKDNNISTIVDNYIEFKETWKNIFGKYPTGGAIKVDYPIKRLVKAYTIKKVCGAIIWAEGNREHNQYIPSFNTPLELEQKWNTIVNQARKNKNLEPLEF